MKRAAADEERGELLKQKLLFIERHGSARERLHLTDVLTAIAKMVEQRRLEETAGFTSEHEAFLIAEAIRQSRAMGAKRGLSYLRYFAQLWPASAPVRVALLKACNAAGRSREGLLDLIQVGGYRCAITMGG